MRVLIAGGVTSLSMMGLALLWPREEPRLEPVSPPPPVAMRRPPPVVEEPSPPPVRMAPAVAPAEPPRRVDEGLAASTQAGATAEEAPALESPAVTPPPPVLRNGRGVAHLATE